jgi:hypothetical protein
MNNAAVIDVELLTVTLLAVTRLPLTLTVAPLIKPVPVSVSTTVVPIKPLPVLSDVNAGTGVAVGVGTGVGLGEMYGMTCGELFELKHPPKTTTIANAKSRLRAERIFPK